MSTTPTHPGPRRRPRSPLRRRGCLPVVIAAVALTLGVVCGGLLFGRQAGPQAEPPSADGPAGPVVQPSAAPSDGDGTPPDVMAPDVEFVEVAGVRLPVSPSAGPRDSSDGLARGFTRDRAGAVLAAGHIMVRLHPEVGADVFAPTLAAQVVGPDTEDLRSNVERGYAELLDQWPVAYGQPAGQLDFSLLGYRVDAFTDRQARIRLLLRVPADDRPSLGAAELRLRWHDGDWALVAPDGGTFAATALVEDPSEFMLWPVEGS